jgi:dolichyl-phosphate-mannose-protein mannosyltransferase
MKVSASLGHRTLGGLMIVAAHAYLLHFVPRGWIPHDEGMLGQSADLVLHGGFPHLDYEEAYTGGLSFVYAALFRLASVDLINVRWLLFGAACWASCLVYAIVRRYLPPTGAALATWVALGWSFPNYFAGLPSWWLLICALACLWTVIRYSETGRLRFLVAAGLAVGAAIAIKQTGVYLVVALVLSLLYDGGRSSRALSRLAHVEALARWGAAVAAIVLAAAILAPRIFDVEGLYLFCPAAACAVVLILPRKWLTESPPARSPLTVVCVATAAAALPLACLLVPYVIRHRLWDFVYGSVLLPRKRLAFASMLMPGPSAILAAFPLLALTSLAASSRLGSWSVHAKLLLWAAAFLVPIAALWNAFSYQLIWQSARLYAALLPVGVCWRLASDQGQHPEHQGAHPEQRPVLFTSAAMLAWTSLNQFPFAAPIYFCYVAPVVVVAAIVATGAGSGPGRVTLFPWAVMLLLFAVLSANRGYVNPLGVTHDPLRFDTPLKLARAHLKVSSGDAIVYRRLVFSIERHLHGGQLIAGPDCPEVYFLSGLTHPSGTLFDFFSDDTTDPSRNDDIGAWLKGAVIILNHEPSFSVAPSAELSERLRREFPYGEDIGRFEIRWR